MRTALRRISAGVLAYGVTYVLIGLLTIGSIEQYLTPFPESDITIPLLEVYRSAGEPLWQAVGWLTLNAHGIPLTVAIESGNIFTLTNLITESKWLGVIPGWLGLVPAIACLAIGAAIALRSPSPAPISWAIGPYMTVGYLIAVLVSTVLFSGAFGPVDASFTLFAGYPIDRWLLPVVVFPLVFGSLGAFLGQTPLVESLLHRARSAS